MPIQRKFERPAPDFPAVRIELDLAEQEINTLGQRVIFAKGFAQALAKQLGMTHEQYRTAYREYSMAVAHADAEDRRAMLYPYADTE